MSTPDLIVQSGSSVVAGADSYASLDDAATFLEQLGGGRLASWEADDADAEKRKAALREATIWSDNRFEWVGEISTRDEHRLRWPRLAVYDRDGRLITGTPLGLRRFVILVALELRTQGPETEAAAETPQLKRKRVGPIEKEWFEPTSTTIQRSYPLARRYLVGLYEPATMSRRMVPR